jgi:glycosyltransferase involved in cell wall biosynthesis
MNEPALSVAFFSQLSSLTGSERSMLELVRELVQNHGARVTVVFPTSGSLVDAVEAVGATSIIAPFYTWHAAQNATPADIGVWMRMSMPGVATVIERLRQINPDVIASNTRFIPWGLVAAQVLKKPHVLFVREAKELIELGHTLRGVEETNALFYDNSEVIFCNSDEPRAQFGDRAKCRVVKMHVPVWETDLREKLPNAYTKTDSFKLLLPGNIYEDKGAADAVAAVDLLTRAGRSVELLLLGQPYEPFTSRLKAEIARLGLTDRIRIAPYHPNPYPYFLQADAVVVCSRGEAFSRVLAEAMTLGVPTVATDILGSRTIAFHEKTTLTYRPGDVPTLAKHIERLIDDTTLRAQLVKNAQAHLRQHFTQESYGGEVFKQLVALKGRTPLPNQRMAELTQSWWESALAEQTREFGAVRVQRDDYNTRSDVRDQQVATLAAQLRIEQRTVAQQNAAVAEVKADADKSHRTLTAIVSTRSWRLRSALLADPLVRLVWRVTKTLTPKGRKR